MTDRLLSFGDVILLKEDLEYLRPGIWLNDRLLTFGSQYIHENLDPDRKEMVTLICAPECEAIKFLPDSVEGIFGSLNLHEKAMVVFIINDNSHPKIANSGSHWSVLAYSRETQYFHHYDSLKNRNDRAAKEVAKHSKSLVRSVEPLQFRSEETPQQQNGSDCGVFALEVIQALLEKGLSMLTPIFEIEQEENNLIIKIHARYAKISDTEVEYCDDLFVFSSKPYYLRIHLPKQVLDDETGWAKYDADAGIFTICVPKKIKGEHFPGLDMVTELLRPQREKPTAEPLVQEVSGGINERGDEEIESEDSEDDYYMEQQPKSIDEKITSGSKTGYGFGWQKSGVLGSLMAEIGQLVELEDPENSPIDERASQCYKMDVKNFNADHYLADTFKPDDQLEHILKLEFECVNRLTKSDIKRLTNLPNRKIPKQKPEELKFLMYSLIDIGFAFCYDGRTTEWENSVESAWTIEKLSASLSWLARFNSIKQTIIVGFSRALTKPLYRNWNLCQAVLTDLKELFKNGRTAMIHALSKVHSLMVKGGEFRYLYNDLLLTDLLLWVQCVDEMVFKNLANELSEIEIQKSDLPELHLEELEVDGQMHLMQIDPEQEGTENTMDSDDLVD
ncbi:unnamed protein product, partial [Mesorhabditis belari]|uniref:Protein SHQ1 homolog n=1 Tax=Mesorhabditis belari TaxID=2138241 RepID=A0AAF3EPA0_9BILA